RVLALRGNNRRHKYSGITNSGERHLQATRHHSNDCVRLVVHSNRAPNQARVSAKSSAPQTVAQNGDMRSTHAAFFRPKIAPDFGLNSEHREKFGGDSGAPHAFWFA